MLVHLITATSKTKTLTTLTLVQKSLYRTIEDILRSDKIISTQPIIIIVTTIPKTKLVNTTDELKSTEYIDNNTFNYIRFVSVV